MSIFEVPISAYKNHFLTTPLATVSLRYFLTSPKLKPQIEEIRARAAAGEDYSALKSKLPGATISGTFEHRADEALKQHSGFIGLDIDGKENTHITNFADLKTELAALPWTAYAGLSCSGTGYFVLFRISDPEKHKAHYEAAREMFARAGLKLDKTSDVSRLRYCSYDPDAYFNESAEVFTELPDEPEKQALQPDQNRVKAKAASVRSGAGKVSPISDYNERADVPALLRDALHWEQLNDRPNTDGRIYFKRSGDPTSNHSANWHVHHRVLRVYSTNTCFEADEPYTASTVLATIKGMDTKELFNHLYNAGYGSEEWRAGYAFNQNKEAEALHLLQQPQPLATIDPATGEVFDYPPEWDTIDPPEPDSPEYAEMLRYEAEAV